MTGCQVDEERVMADFQLSVLSKRMVGDALSEMGRPKDEKEETVMGSELEGRKDEGSFGCVELLLYFFSLKRKEKFY